MSSVKGMELSKYIIPVAIGVLLTPVIQKIYKETVEIISNTVYDTLIINKKENPPIHHFLMREISKKVPCNRVAGGSIIRYTPKCGKYTITINDREYGEIDIYVELKEDMIILYSWNKKNLMYFGTDLDMLKRYVESVNKMYNSPDKCRIFYMLKDNEWFPTYRDPLNIEDIDITDNMQQVVDYISENRTVKNHTGICLTGPPGSGKTTCAEYIAHLFGCNTYSFNMNSNNIDSATFQNLMGTVNPNSIVLFDEFESQLEAVKENNTANVGNGGILSGFDGTPRLPNGTILIIITNNNDKIPNNLSNALFREGRISKCFEFTL